MLHKKGVSDMKRILYYGWIGYKNLGDDLMWDIFRNMSKTYLDKNKFKIIPFLPNKNLKKIKFDIIVLGGGSLIAPSFINDLDWAVKRKKKVIIWGSGYDRIDKIEMLKLINNKSAKHRFTSQDIRQLRNVISHAEFVGVRGPLTFRSLKQMGINNNKLHISGDPGLLLKPKKPLDVSQNKRQKIVGINWGTTSNQIYGNNEVKVENQLVQAIKKLIKKGYKIYIYSVWKEDHKACTRLYQKIADNENVTLDLRYHHQDQLMEILRKFNFTINFKLHPNLISGAAGVPFIALGYRFKVYDFAKSVGLEKMVVPTDSTNIEQQILNLEKYISNNHQLIRNKYQNATRKYKGKLLTPFKIIKSIYA